MSESDKDKDQKRGDEILRRLLKTPPQPKETGKDKKPKRKPKDRRPPGNATKNR
jgi:hypothetical protein